VLTTASNSSSECGSAATSPTSKRTLSDRPARRAAGRALDHRARDVDAGERYAGSLLRQPHGELARATPDLQ
jgi:hypothetical protein